MPNPSRQKGDRFERQIVEYFQERGINAERIPLSGSSPFGSFSGFDLTVPMFGTTLRAEAKHKGSGFQTLYNFLAHGSNDFLIVRQDRAAPLAIVPLELLVHMSNGTLATRKPVKKKKAAKKKKT